MSRGFLVLEDGTVYEGQLFGCECKNIGEVVFSTGMAGYQETLTDPASEGQVVVMTYPLIGNYGVADRFDESDRVHASGLVVREYCPTPSGMFGGALLEEMLVRDGIPAISGIDTREIAIKLRTSGTLKGAIVPEGTDIPALVDELKSAAQPWESDLVSKVSRKDIIRHDNGKDMTVGIIDCGVRASVINDLDTVYNTITFPYNTPAEDILSSGVQGVIVSNGPGNPSCEGLKGVTVKTIEDLSSRLPIYGIGLGGQLVALAFGANATKLKYGHHGSNMPVKFGSRVYITAENNGFAIDASSIDGTDLEVEQVNVNDNSVAGVAHKNLPVMTSQYYPGASGTCKDMPALMDRFTAFIKEGKL